MLTAVLAYALTGVLILALVASAIYVGSRLARIVGTRRRWPYRLALLAIVSGAILFTALAVRSSDPAVGTLYVWFGYAFYLLLNLVMTLAFAQLIGRFAGRSERVLGGIAIAVAVAVTAAGAVRAGSFVVEETTIPVAGLDRPLKIMQISDLHIGHHRGAEYLARVVAETNRRKPDLVVVTGDLLDSHAALRPGLLDPLKRLSAPAFYVIGNHEKDLHSPLALRRIAQAGLRILNNQVVEFRGIQFAGLDYMNADETAFNLHPSLNEATVRSVLPTLKLRRDKPTVLLQHGPFGAEYAQAAGVGLVLAGHTHGGQVFPFNLLAPAIFPFNHGLYSLGTTGIFVSPGVGTFMLRARMGTSNQLDLLQLVPARRDVPNTK